MDGEAAAWLRRAVAAASRAHGSELAHALDMSAVVECKANLAGLFVEAAVNLPKKLFLLPSGTDDTVSPLVPKEALGEYHRSSFSANRFTVWKNGDYHIMYGHFDAAAWVLKKLTPSRPLLCTLYVRSCTRPLEPARYGWRVCLHLSMERYSGATCCMLADSWMDAGVFCPTGPRPRLAGPRARPRW